MARYQNIIVISLSIFGIAAVCCHPLGYSEVDRNYSENGFLEQQIFQIKFGQPAAGVEANSNAEMREHQTVVRFKLQNSGKVSASRLKHREHQRRYMERIRAARIAANSQKTVSSSVERVRACTGGIGTELSSGRLSDTREDTAEPIEREKKSQSLNAKIFDKAEEAKAQQKRRKAAESQKRCRQRRKVAWAENPKLKESFQQKEKVRTIRYREKLDMARFEAALVAQNTYAPANQESDGNDFLNQRINIHFEKNQSYACKKKINEAQGNTAKLIEPEEVRRIQQPCDGGSLLDQQTFKKRVAGPDQNFDEGFQGERSNAKTRICNVQKMQDSRNYSKEAKVRRRKQKAAEYAKRYRQNLKVVWLENPEKAERCRQQHNERQRRYKERLSRCEKGSKAQESREINR